MKKLSCFLMALLLIVLYGCQTQESLSSSTPESASIDETESSIDNASDFNSTESSIGDESDSSTPSDADDNSSDYSFDPNSTLPILSDDEKEVVSVDKFSYIFGEIIGKMSPNVLVVKLDPPLKIEAWGEIVYVITDEADEWCINDVIVVPFSKAERPLDKSQYVRIIADEIHSYMEIVTEKPIVYFYPEEPTTCSVSLTINGRLTCTYPNYENGWDNFTAYPDGTLIFPDGKEYYALYWEGIQNSQWDFTQGYCVRGEDTAEFLEWALSEQGLTSREANEFIIYWLPLMQDNPYNVISFQTTTYTDNAILEISPSPDALLRVFMAYYPSSSVVEIQPQAFDEFDRHGFTVVEWGGCEVETLTE